MSINSRIKERREALGLSRIELASMIGVTPSAIANYENGISSPKIELLYKLFDALKCDANYLYQDEMTELNKSDSLLLSKKGASEEAHVRIKDILVYPGIANADIISRFRNAVNIRTAFYSPLPVLHHSRIRRLPVSSCASHRSHSRRE